MIKLCSALLISILIAGCTPQRQRPEVQHPAAKLAARAGTLKLAEWNMEFLAAANGSGCHPRQDADYAAIRRTVEAIGADVFAFEEVENEIAAARVFDPARYVIVMEQRPGEPGGSCGTQAPGQSFIRQAVGFAIRKGLSFSRAPDVTELEVGNFNLRSGVDITVTPAGSEPIRLMVVHLKSGCFQGSAGPACPQLLKQIPVVSHWIDTAAAGPIPFAVMGDWNRRLALAGDLFWATIDDKRPPDDDLTLTDRGMPSRCDPKFADFIDHIVLDRRAGGQVSGFHETTFAPGQNPSDHCPIAVVLHRQE